MKIIKGIIKILIAVLIIGVIVAGIGLMVGGIKIGDLREGFYNDNDYTAKEVNEEFDVETIAVDAENNIINITVSSDNLFNITYHEAEYHLVNISDSANTLTIKTEDNRRWNWFNFGTLSASVRTINIQVPETFAGVIDIKTSNGSVTIDGVANIIDIKVITSNGKISLSDMTVEDVDIKSSNGKLEISDFYVENELIMETSNGSIEVTNVEAEKVIMLTSNGSINTIDLNSKHIDARTSNGSIDLKVIGVYNEYKIDINTSNGSNTVNGVGYTNQILNPNAANYLKAKTSNGNNKITIA